MEIIVLGYERTLSTCLVRLEQTIVKPLKRDPSIDQPKVQQINTRQTSSDDAEVLLGNEWESHRSYYAVNAAYQDCVPVMETIPEHC
jgi:hypothetical protein